MGPSPGAHVLLVTHIPIFVKGPTAYLENGWLRDVLLARDWLAAPFGSLSLLAPWRPARPTTRRASLPVEASP